MMLQNLNALFPMPGGKPGSAMDGPKAEIAGAGGWADILAGFEGLATSGAPDGEAQTQALLSSLQELKALSAQGGDEGLTEDLAGHFAALFALLESGPAASFETVSDELQAVQRAPGQPHYEAEFWPTAGEMILLLQGISPWGEDIKPEQTQWLEQVGPYLGVPALTASFAGPTELGRQFTVVNLAEAAGADPQRAFVDAWLGRHKPDVAHNAYHSRWSLEQSQAPASAVLKPEPGAARGMPEINRSVLFSQMAALPGASAPDGRDAGPATARADVSLVQINSAVMARDPGLPPTTLLSGQPQATPTEMRAAAEQAMERVAWMAARKQGSSQARLQLHPAHLGKLDIRLDMHGREASLHLTVHNAPVREALEAMLPRLREQFEQQGLQLGDASVSDSGPEDMPDRQVAQRAGSEAQINDDDTLDSVPGPDGRQRGLGLVDEFA